MSLYPCFRGEDCGIFATSGLPGPPITKVIHRMPAETRRRRGGGGMGFRCYNPCMNKHLAISLDPRDRFAIERLVRPLLDRTNARLLLFGSRARGDARRTSDIDLALSAAEPIPAEEMARLREALEESRVPFRVDLVDCASIPLSLRQAIEREGVAWPV